MSTGDILLLIFLLPFAIFPVLVGIAALGFWLFTDEFQYGTTGDWVSLASWDWLTRLLGWMPWLRK